MQNIRTHAIWPSIHAVLFDLGGTLLRNGITVAEEQAIWEQVYARLVVPTVLQRAAHPVPPLEHLYQAIVEHVGRTIAVNGQKKGEQELAYVPLFDLAFQAAGLQSLAEPEFLHQIVGMEVELRFTRLFEHGIPAAGTLMKLRERGYQLGFVSNLCCLADLVYLNLERLGVLRLFDQTVLSCEVGWRKPSPRIFAAICEKMRIAPQACLFVGDRLIEDISGAQRFGMRAILTHEFRQELPHEGILPDAVIDRLDQLLDILA